MLRRPFAPFTVLGTARGLLGPTKGNPSDHPKQELESRAMATSRTKKSSKKTEDKAEVAATEEINTTPDATEEPPPPTDPAPQTPPPPPVEKPKAALKKGKKAKRPPEPTSWVVKVNGKVVGEPHPNKMEAIRAGVALKAANVTVDPA